MTEKDVFIDPYRLKAIKKQAIHNQNIDPVIRVSIAMKHIASLKKMRKEANRVDHERI